MKPSTQTKGGGVAISQVSQQTLDSSVGFSGGAPAAANISVADKNVGVSMVAGGWAYQGSHAAYGNEQRLNAQGHFINSIRAKDGVANWRAEISGAQIQI